jgi:putative ATP-binding cassette transporter
VEHSYFSEAEGRLFTLGPLNLTIEPGTLLFIAGGNGSGKTTLGKVLAGLYAPHTGEILLNGEPVSQCSLDAYRQYFSAVFSDFYVFETLLGIPSDAIRKYGPGMLNRLRLDRVTQIHDGRFSRVDLSQGQRKRLALLTAFLEDRPFYLFDEWAADQDPVFREIFYREILPSLRSAGKTVIVITHDDRYFSTADRLISLENGKITYDSGCAGMGRSRAMGVSYAV